MCKALESTLSKEIKSERKKARREVRERGR
jgi:hypothetical protein